MSADTDAIVNVNPSAYLFINSKLNKNQIKKILYKKW